MKYVLMVGFCYQKYKKNLNVQIFSGSTMIDDLTIDEDIIDPAVNITLDPVYALTHQSTLPTKWFCFEVNEEILEDDITVKFKLHDNNYSNGFMTKTALAKINCIALVPKNFIDEHDPYKSLKRLLLENDASRKILKRKFDTDVILSLNDHNAMVKNEGQVQTWIRQIKNKKIKLSDLPLQAQILMFERGQRSSCGFWPTNPDNYKVHSGTTHCSVADWIGGEFKIVVPLIRKFNVIMCDPYAGTKKYGKIKYMRGFDRLFNKYKTINTSR
jgi:hypothetical protein